MYDIVLRNGFLTDSQNGLNGQVDDIAIKDETIVAIGSIEEKGIKEIDVTGLYVTPELIDFHSHFYEGGTLTSLRYSDFAATGVTYACDAGSAGDSNIESFINSLTAFQKRNSSLYIYVSSK